MWAGSTIYLSPTVAIKTENLTPIRIVLSDKLVIKLSSTRVLTAISFFMVYCKKGDFGFPATVTFAPISVHNLALQFFVAVPSPLSLT
jgi:hypothetical protein